MNLIMNTSFRSRGKWGDYLVTLIPLSWCLNILLNSNFILRMIEWQSESGAILIRIHGKQWYWVYKYDATSIFSALDLYKNTGTNLWGNFAQKESKLSEQYIQAVFLKNRLSAQQEYWSDVSNKEFNLTSTFNVFDSKKLNTVEPLFIENTVLEVDSTQTDVAEQFVSYQVSDVKELVDSEFSTNTRPWMEGFVNSNTSLVNTSLDFLKSTKVSNIFLKNPYALFFYENQTLDDTWEVYSNVLVYDVGQPFRILPMIAKNNNIDNSSCLFFTRFFDSNELVVEKPEENIEFLVIKQKRYKRKQNINKYSAISSNTQHIFESVKLKNQSYQTARFLKNNYLFQQITNTGAKTPFDFYTTIKLNRVRSETFSINLARRLLRTTRTLVLPAYTNISIIANSYDVVHSWFIPGLGLKIDCVPGKSTHHSLYIDNVGLYYGQCAEICGRYHHHMPIRICALPFDHFIVWWTTKGFPKALKMKYNPKKIEQALLVKYVW